MAEAAASFDVLEYQVDTFLKEWGRFHRREQSPAPAGYPAASVEGRMMEAWGRNSGGGKRNSRIWKPGGQACKQTVSQRMSAQWPADVSALDRVIAELPRRLSDPVIAYYVYGHSTRTGASLLKISHMSMSNRLSQAKWFVAGKMANYFL